MNNKKNFSTANDLHYTVCVLSMLIYIAKHLAIFALACTFIVESSSHAGAFSHYAYIIIAFTKHLSLLQEINASQEDHH